MKKRQRIGLLFLVGILSLSFFVIFVVVQQQSPKVLLGGQAVSMAYTNEGFYFLDESYFMGEDPVLEGETIIQIGEIPLLSRDYLVRAFRRYAGNEVPIKTISQGKLYEKTVTLRAIPTEDDFSCRRYVSGIVSMFLPELECALAFSHAIDEADGLVHGLVFPALPAGADVETQSMEIEVLPEAVGTILSDEEFGVIFHIRPEYMPKREVTIARQEDVKLGKASLYMNLGEGSQEYAIQILQLDGTGYEWDEGEVPNYTHQEEDVISRHFLFAITDERLLEIGIEQSFSGMSGTPILQNGKLIGFVTGTIEETNYGEYAEIAYDRLQNQMRMQNSLVKRQKLRIKEEPQVLLAETGGIYDIRQDGATIVSSEQEEIPLQKGDIVVAINDQVVECYDDLCQIVTWWQTQTQDEIVVSYLRKGSLKQATIPRDAKFQVATKNRNLLADSYLTMIDPETFHYAGGKSENEEASPANTQFGIVLDAMYTWNVNEPIEYTSHGNVLATVTKVGEKGTYGYILPRSYEEQDLVSIASKTEVTSGEAMLDIPSHGYTGQRIKRKVQLECQEKEIRVTLLEEENGNNNMEYYFLQGLPIFQNGKLVAILHDVLEDNSAMAWYAMDVYEEMMTSF